MTEWVSLSLEPIDDNFGYVHGVNHSYEWRVEKSCGA